LLIEERSENPEAQRSQTAAEQSEVEQKGGKDAAGKGILAPTAGNTTVHRRELLEHF